MIQASLRTGVNPADRICGLGKYILQNTGERNSRKSWIGALAAVVVLKMVLNTILQSIM